MKKHHTLLVQTLVIGWLYLSVTTTILAQTTAFTYQGKLTDSGNLANGNYDLQFKLFDTVTVGTGIQQGSTVTVSNIVVSNGIFTVSLDFGACPTCFDGSARFLEIAVRVNGGGSFTTLTPRQPITSTPYALKSANATTADGLSVACVNCVTSSQIGSVNGSAVTGAIPVASVPAGSGNYIQNTTSQQASSNFNISGTGTADILNAATRYNLNGQQVLSAAGSQNLFAGINAGSNNTGSNNAFFGTSAGQANTSGSNNAFFGAHSGQATTTGNRNAFFGQNAGFNNTTGLDNAIFGAFAGVSTTTGTQNVFFGENAGFNNTTGNFNTFIGRNADFDIANPTGDNNTLLGGLARVTSGFSNATAIGFRAQVSASNSLVLGGITGVNGGTSVNIGIGTTTPAERLHVVGNGLFTGNLSASIVNATTQYNLNGLRVFTVNGPYTSGGTVFTASNTFAGEGAGLNTTPDPAPSLTNGKFNAFFAAGAGQENTTGSRNAFFGFQAGQFNTTGFFNSFFGAEAGFNNTTGGDNAFFGTSAGQANTIGSDNAFFGVSAGIANTTGCCNAFSGFQAGHANTTGQFNAFFGWVAGQFNTTGQNNTFIGSGADFNTTNPTGDNNTLLGFNTNVDSGHSNATAIGALASVTQSNSLILGSINGVNGATADTKVGIGTTAPLDKLHVAGDIRVGTGTTGCVKDADGTLIAGNCSSDARLKRAITPFPHLLDKLVQLQPVTFYWRADEFKERHFGTKPSYGLIAQEVEKVLPELVTEDEKGYKAVNYSKLTLLTLQAIKELKAENDTLKQQLLEQQQEMAAVKKLLCQSQPQADLCKAKALK